VAISRLIMASFRNPSATRGISRTSTSVLLFVEIAVFEQCEIFYMQFRQHGGWFFGYWVSGCSCLSLSWSDILCPPTVMPCKKVITSGNVKGIPSRD
jgi:hypothetical protein